MPVHHAIRKRADKLQIKIEDIGFGAYKVTDLITGTSYEETGDPKNIIPYIGEQRAQNNVVSPAPILTKTPKVRTPAAALPPSLKKARKIKEKKLPKSDGEGGDLDEDGDSGKPASKSIVSARYKKKYRPNKDTCGDQFVTAMHDFLYPDGAEDLDIRRLAALARDNGIDLARWAHLKNVGMKRMNCGNMLRSRVKAGKEVKIGALKFGGKNATQ
jgi:hypothetical protein